MKTPFRASALILFGLLSLSNAQDPTVQIVEPGFVSLFDGKTIDRTAWDGSDKWKVENGEIRMHDSVPETEYLIYKKKKYQDFIFKVKFILWNNTGNTGIHFRSRYLTYRPHNVGGYQADIGWDWDGRLIYFVEDANPNVFVLAEPQPGCKSAFKFDNTWNEYTITAKGAKIKLEMNGVYCSEYTETDQNRLKDSGYIALQFHNSAATEVRFRDIRIKSLDPKDSVVTLAPALRSRKTKAAKASQPKVFITKEFGPISAESGRGTVNLKGATIAPKSKSKKVTP